MKPEMFFLRYAFPCSFILLLRREITPEEHNLLYKSVKEKKLYLSKEKIKSIFWRPMKFIKSLSNLETIQKYWWFDHNKYLKLGKFKDIKGDLVKQCMVIPCEVLSVSRGEAIVKSFFLDGTAKLKTDFVDVKPGDKVTKHYGYVCEKIPENLYLKIVESLKRL